MSQPSIRPMTPRGVRILYAALWGGPLGVGALLSTMDDAVSAFAPADVLGYIAVGAFVVDAIGARVARGRISPLATGADEAAWWVANLPKALAVWAFTESGVLLAVAVYVGTRDWVPLAAAAAGLFMLWGARPERLLEG